MTVRFRYESIERYLSLLQSQVYLTIQIVVSFCNLIQIWPTYDGWPVLQSDRNAIPWP
jgi:hypothetical protein